MKMTRTLGIGLACALGTGTFTTNVNADILDNPGFEVDATTANGLPDQVDIWSGDLTQITTAQRFCDQEGQNCEDVIPFEGTQMLHLIGTLKDGGSSFSIGSEVWQLVDLSDFSSIIQTGNAVANASAWFYRIMGDAQTDTRFSVTLTTYSGDPVDFPNLWSGADPNRAEGEVFIDDDLQGSWQMAETSLTIPVDATFLALRLTATEDIFNDSGENEFDGHFADAVELTIVPTPTAAMALLIGAGVATGRRRRRDV